MIRIEVFSSEPIVFFLHDFLLREREDRFASCRYILLQEFHSSLSRLSLSRWRMWAIYSAPAFHSLIFAC